MFWTSLDPELFEEAVDHLLGVADAAEAEVAEERLRGDERHRGDVAQAGLLDLVANVEHELIGGAKARPALCGADHDRPGVLQEPVPRVAGEQRVPQVADRLRMPIVRSQTGDLLEREPRSGADQQAVVGELLAGANSHGVRSRVDRRDRLVDEPNSLARVHRPQRERDVVWFAAAERNPDQRRDERELRTRVEHDDLVPVTQALAQFESLGHAGEARPDDHDTLAIRTGHDSLLASAPSRDALVGLRPRGR